MERVTIFGVGASVFTLLVVSALFFLLFLAYLALALLGRRPRSQEMADRGETIYLPLFLREWWDWVIAPATRLLIRLKINPNTITFMSFLVALGAGAALACGYFGLGGWLYIVAGTCDMFDGKVARATKSASKAGAFIDSTLDRYTEIFVLGGLAWFFKGTLVLWAALGALAGSLMVSYTRARGEGLGCSYREGGMLRAERIVYVSLAGIFGKLAEALFPPTKWSVPFMAAVVVLLAVATNATAIHRFFGIVRALKAGDEDERDGIVVRHPAARERART